MTTLDPTALALEIGMARIDALHWRTESAKRDHRIEELEAEIARLKGKKP